MDPATIIAAVAAGIKLAVDLGPTVIATVEDAKPFAEQILKLVQGGNVTQEDLDTYMASLDTIHAEIQAAKA